MIATQAVTSFLLSSFGHFLAPKNGPRVNHRFATRLLQHLNPFNELLEFAINRFIKGHKGDGTPPGHQRNDEWMSFWKNRKHFIHFVEKLKNFEKNLEQNWFIWKQIYWKRVCYEPYFYSLFPFFYLQLTLLQIREKCISKVLDYKLVQQWSLQKIQWLIACNEKE